jgi:hypothetical protein
MPSSTPGDIAMSMGEGARIRTLLLLAAAACLFVGCFRGPKKEDLDPGEKHILKIASLYMDYRGSHRGNPPRDAQELKNWAKDLKKEQLAARGMEDMESVFTSPRDNQPYVLVKPEAARAGAGGRPPMVLVYEQTGVNGKRMAAGAMGGAAFEMDEESFQQLVQKGR